MTVRSRLDLPEDDLFGPHNLPYGVFTAPDRPGVRRIGVAIGGWVLDAVSARDAACATEEAHT